MPPSRSEEVDLADTLVRVTEVFKGTYSVRGYNRWWGQDLL